MKKLLLRIFSVITAVSVPAVYNVKYDTDVMAVVKSNAVFSLPDFDCVAGQNGGKPFPTSKGIEYYNNKISRFTNIMPTSFDMRENGTVSSVKDQKTYGTCWCHSSASSAESSIINAVPSIDLSELHTAFYSYYGDNQIITSANDIQEHLDWGGSTGVVANLWSQWIGPVNESRLPYDNVDFFEDYDKVADMQYTSDYHLENAYIFDFNDDRTNADDINNLVKQFVYNGNSVDVSFYYNYSQTFNPSYNSSYTTKPSKFANHAVTIVGWDDDFPAEHFKGGTQNNGAWLIKNSWSYDSGDDGYIWISYDDRSLCEFAVYELGDNDNYTINYHYDTFIPTQLISAQENPNESGFSYMANVFTAESDMQLDAVSTYFQNTGTNYEITIYTGLTDETSPSSGTPSEITYGYESLTGYRSIELTESVPLKHGEKFGVVVKLSCEENPFVIPVEASLFIRDSQTGEITDINVYSSAEQIENNTDYNQSFYSPDGESWSDTFGEEQVFTDEEKEIVLESLKADIYEGISENDTEELKNADLLYNFYEELFATGDLCITLGNISLKAFGNPLGKVDFSHIEGEIPLNESVSLSADGEIFVSLNDSEYIPYTEPIKITSETKISAYTNPMFVTEKTYKPAKAGFNDICYSGSYKEFKKATKISNNEYLINAELYDSEIILYLVTGAEIIMDGENIKSSESMKTIPVEYGEKIITFELEQENKLPDTIMLRIVKNPVSFDLENETIHFPVGFTVTTEDGINISSGENVGGYAGQNVTAVYKSNSEEIVCQIPERAVLPELETDYYYETLGFIPNDTAELLEYSVKENPDITDYFSAKERLIDGTWINSGMIMNKAFKVIPGEKITFRIKAGNGMFASQPVTYEIPQAPSAPVLMPDFVEENGKYSLSGYKYEIALAEKSDFSALAELWGYSDVNSYISVLENRSGIKDKEKLNNIGSEWRADYILEKGQTVIIRLASTDDNFASQCRFITIGESKGDINNDSFVDAVDASLLLVHYADLSTNGKGTITEDRMFTADYNDDGLIDAIDASALLVYYAEVSTEK